MNTYKKTSEYAYDLLMHFYKLHLDQIKLIGEKNIKILCPNEIFELLAARSPFSKEIIYNTEMCAEF